MAISYTVSYTFSPSTTISSSQVNTNFSDNANTWNGLEALTKSFAKLKIDVDPSSALEVATKQYVDHYSGYKRPVLSFGSVTTVAVESGVDGTSGDIPLLFPDGTMRIETSTMRTTFDITRNAVLITSGAQSGLTGATSEATNTWYALYGCKITDSSTLWVTVGSTVLPLQANFSTLNTAYGSNGWVYLGMIRNGDNSGATGDILVFDQAGNHTMFRNVCTSAAGSSGVGLRLASSGGATSLTWAYSAGTGTTNVPNQFKFALIMYIGGARTAAVYAIQNSGSDRLYSAISSNGATVGARDTIFMPLLGGLALSDTQGGTSNAMDINIVGWVDNVLGVGSNPLL